MALRGRAKVFSGEWVVRSADVRLGCVGERKCSGRACRCAGAGEGLRRGMGCGVGGECIAHPLCGAVFLCPKRNRGGERRSSAGNAWRSLRVCVGAAWGSGRAREGSEKMLGKSVSLCGGGRRLLAGNVLWGRRGLTHFRRSSTRARVLLYIRPPCPRREIAAMGRKGAPAKAHRPPNDVRPCRSNVHTSAPAFTLPPHTLWRRPRRLRPPAAAVIHNALSTEKLSTSLLAALCKTFSPSRLRTRIYNISFARRPLPGVSAPLWGRGRAVVAPCPAPPSAGWGRARAKADAPSRSAPYLPAYGRAPAACVPNHCAQRRSAQGNPRSCPCVLPASACLRPCPCRLCAESLCAKAECTRQSPLLPVRSPRVSLSTAAPLPADGRSAERKGGSAQGNPRSCPCVLPATACLRPCLRPLMGEVPCVLPAPACLRPCSRPLMGVALCVLPATACLRPRPCPLMGEAPSAKAEVHQANPAPARAFSPRQPAYGRAPARLWANCRAFSPRQLVYRRAPAA